MPRFVINDALYLVFIKKAFIFVLITSNNEAFNLVLHCNTVKNATFLPIVYVFDKITMYMN